jgi:DNA-binding transcriptional MocR family regulator
LLETGHIDAGATLPPERALAAALAVSRTTVAAAYAELRRDGWVDARQGSATRVTAARHSPVGAHKANGLFATLLRDHPDVIDLTIAVPSAAPVVTEVLADPARHLDNVDDLTSGHGYHPRGHPALREALARVLTSRGLPTGVDDLLVTNGAQQAISLAVSSLARPGDGVAMEAVSFPGALDAVEARGARPIPVPMGRDGIDAGALRAVLRENRPRLAYIIPTFHNPTGCLVDGLERRRLARVVADEAVTTIDDLTVGDLDHGRPAPLPLAAVAPDAPIITVGSMSKVFWGGLRVGWIRARPALIDHLAAAKVTNDMGSSAPTQVLAAAMLTHHAETREWRNRQVAHTLDVVGAALAEHLPEWQWDRPPGGPHLWIRLPGMDAVAFSQRLLRLGVAVVAGPLLAVRPGSAGDRIRVPLYAPPDRMVQAVELMAVAWQAAVGRAG